MKKLNEKELLKTPVFTVVEKTFEGVNFHPVGLNCNDWVMVVAYDKTGNAIFVNQTRWGLEKETVEFPCGTVEKSEIAKYGSQNARRTAALRELEEETGISVNEDQLVQIAHFNPNPAYFNNTMTIFKVQVENLEKLFKKRKELALDEHEDCKPYIAKIKDKKESLVSHAMGLIAFLSLELEV